MALAGIPLASMLAAIRDLAIPPSCPVCARICGSEGLCARCWGRARLIDRPYCEVTGAPFPFDSGGVAISPAAIADPPPFRRHRSAMVYDDIARRLATGLKFSDRAELAPFMARLMAAAGRELVAEADLIVPAPLHRLRLQSRRYNQAAEIARHLAVNAGLAFAPLALERRRNTQPQIGLGRKERMRNVAGAFLVPPGEKAAVAGRRILLVDDIYTTGSTLSACARALLRAGAASVDALTFAMAAPVDI
jgi:ComF family protein